MVKFHLVPLAIASLVVGEQFLFPPPAGPYKVAVASEELVDQTRLDPYNSSHARRLMVSRFQPVPDAQCTQICRVPYMPTYMAEAQDAILTEYLASVGWPAGVIGKLQMELCCETAQIEHQKCGPTFPLMLFGTGLNTTRMFSAATAQHLASIGYYVVTMDHPYETDIVKFPDGTIIYGGNVNKTDPASLDFAVDVRTADATFVLNSLRVPASAKVAYVGHSFGGAAAAAAMPSEKRIAAGVNMDGSMWGSVVTTGVDGPFLLWGSPGHNTSDILDPTWANFWEAQEQKHREQWKKELSLRGGLHGSFTDFSSIGDITGLRNNQALVDNLFGVILGSRVMEIEKAYLDDFFRMTMKGEGEGLLSGPSEDYPEVEFLR